MDSARLALKRVYNRAHCMRASESDTPHRRSLQPVATPLRTHTSVSSYIKSGRPTQQDFSLARGRGRQIAHNTGLSLFPLPIHCREVTHTSKASMARHVVALAGEIVAIPCCLAPIAASIEAFMPFVTGAAVRL